MGHTNLKAKKTHQKAPDHRKRQSPGYVQEERIVKGYNNGVVEYRLATVRQSSKLAGQPIMIGLGASATTSMLLEYQATGHPKGIKASAKSLASVVRKLCRRLGRYENVVTSKEEFGGAAR